MDFKQSIPSAAKIARTMVAFANLRGGRIVVGVGDSGYIHGIDPEEEKHMLEEAGQHFCDPAITPKYTVHEYEGVSVLEAYIPQGTHKPYRAMGDDGQWKVYIRNGDRSMLATGTVIRQLTHDEGEAPSRLPDSKERALLDYLEHTTFITPNEFARMMNISRARAKSMMINMAHEGFLLHHSDEKGDYFSLK